ncbi:family 43 glycosylhydrolase [Pedobacter rhizosphaerae]|uniref:Glycosyl hydrolases family 43 n=1 Tax=Pedobacter rhizosphaerae TaxID=390241 RepID=A0A1H9VQN4_9SPHI|nr:family 43 glycosylhydrolase [Pedobacter rhizosphaerae]SES23965.1 Glycosyl hydrolases family 43 [Pedobacter rhizosphaerae]
MKSNINRIMQVILVLALWLPFTTSAQPRYKYQAIHSGVPLVDDKGNTLSAHGACIIKEGRRYYLFGEKHSDTSNAFEGFNCYSSADLISWKFERLALPRQTSGKLGPKRIGERAKVMKSPETGEYVMFMHVDTLGYTDQFIGYATSSSITGPYQFRGPLLFNGQAIRKWDMGTFQDHDGSGYLLIHGGEIYKLSADYKSIVKKVNGNMTPGFESPAMLKKDNVYYFLGSDLTSWERNDNYYYTSNKLSGPWIKKGFFSPPGTLTWNSQTTFVLPIISAKDTMFMFMGDRWSYPKQASAATYVWQPLSFIDTNLSMSEWYDSWRISPNGKFVPYKIIGDTIFNSDHHRIRYKGEWQLTNDHIPLSTSAVKGNSFTVSFEGTQAALYSLSSPSGGYVNIELIDAKGKVLLSNLVDNYSKYTNSSVKYITPLLKKGKYTLSVMITGEKSNWSDKRKNLYGSTGTSFSFDKLIIKR